GNLMKPYLTEGFVGSTHLNATGITEILKLLPAYLKLFGDIIRLIRTQRPDAVIFVDNPGLNLRIAGRIAGLNIPMFYYICPQVWAWHSERVHKLKKWFRSLYVIFEFEKDFFDKHQTESIFVGHPLAAQMSGFLPKAQPRPASGRLKQILLLPGSRAHEIRRLLPDMLSAVSKLKQTGENPEFSVIEIETVPKTLYDRLLSGYPEIKRLDQKNKYETFLDADIAICCSGTVTLECAMLGLPMIIINKSSWLTAQIARRVLTIEYLGLPNLLASETICPELLQENCTGENISQELIKYLKDPELVKKTSVKLTEITKPLSEHDAPKQTAADVLTRL
ncbi:MAG: lipid-A-disaccharide synthase, partial [Candidatus Omnitrophica bacterium]|nr:lipid-A-disaccharide synthase [Candidatus Omnitrophota bacterium]